MYHLEQKCRKPIRQASTLLAAFRLMSAGQFLKLREVLLERRLSGLDVTHGEQIEHQAAHGGDVKASVHARLRRCHAHTLEEIRGRLNPRADERVEQRRRVRAPLYDVAVDFDEKPQLAIELRIAGALPA